MLYTCIARQRGRIGQGRNRRNAHGATCTACLVMSKNPLLFIDVKIIDLTGWLRPMYYKRITKQSRREFQTSSSRVSSRVSSYSNFYSINFFVCDKIYQLIWSIILAGISTRWNVGLIVTLTITLTLTLTLSRSSRKLTASKLDSITRLQDFAASAEDLQYLWNGEK